MRLIAAEADGRDKGFYSSERMVVFAFYQQTVAAKKDEEGTRVVISASENNKISQILIKSKQHVGDKKHKMEEDVDDRKETREPYKLLYSIFQVDDV